jgi:hypothetical protein
MIIHDSDNLLIVEEADNSYFMSLDNDSETVTVQVNEQTLENLFDDLVDYFAKKSESLIDAETLEELSRNAEKKDNVLKLR